MYPINLDVRGKRVVVVGGGPVAERKVRGLLEAGAAVAVISPAVTPALAELAGTATIAIERRAFERGDLRGATLAFAATDDAEANAAVVDEARAAAILVDDVTAPERSDFSTPAVHRSGPLVVGVDTSGSPRRSPRGSATRSRGCSTLVRPRRGDVGPMREYVQTALPRERRAAVMRRLAAANIERTGRDDPGRCENAVEHAVDDMERASGARSDAEITPLVCASRGSAARDDPDADDHRPARGERHRLDGPEDLDQRRRRQDRSLAAIGTDSIFVKELETALREGRADYAVHSCKDLPSTLPDDMKLAAITTREDPATPTAARSSRRSPRSPSGARVGTSSPRRRAQLARAAPRPACTTTSAATSTPACASCATASTTRSCSRSRA